MKAPHYDICSEGEDRPSDNSNDGELWLDEVDLIAVTFGNMSIDSKPVATDGERGRYREITVDSGVGESVVNPDHWPNIDLKPSKGSVKGQRYVGPGGDKVDNLGESTVKVCTERHGGSDISSRMTLQGAKVRKPLLAVSGVIDKGNIVVFRWKWILPTAKHMCWCRICEKGKHRGSRTCSAACEMKPPSCGRGTLRTGRRRIPVGGEPLKRSEHQAE